MGKAERLLKATKGCCFQKNTYVKNVKLTPVTSPYKVFFSSRLFFSSSCLEKDNIGLALAITAHEKDWLSVNKSATHTLQLFPFVLLCLVFFEQS